LYDDNRFAPRYNPYSTIHEHHCNNLMTPYNKQINTEHDACGIIKVECGLACGIVCTVTELNKMDGYITYLGHFFASRSRVPVLRLFSASLFCIPFSRPFFTSHFSRPFYHMVLRHFFASPCLIPFSGLFFPVSFSRTFFPSLFRVHFLSPF